MGHEQNSAKTFDSYLQQMHFGGEGEAVDLSAKPKCWDRRSS